MILALTTQERDTARSVLSRTRGERLSGHTYRVGDRVWYDGSAYDVYDHDAEGNTSLLILLSPDGYRIARGIAAADISTSRPTPSLVTP